MTKLRLTIFSVIVVLIALVSIITYSKGSLVVKYYEAFRYVNTGENTRRIIFINELKKPDTANRWHIEVYFNKDGEWLKFNNISPDNSIYEVITNKLSIKSISSKSLIQ